MTVVLKEWKSCAVNCKFGFEQKKADAAFGLPNGGGTAGVLRSMESAQYYAENNIAMARRWVSTILDIAPILCKILSFLSFFT